MGGEKSQEKSHQLAWFSEEERVPVAVQILALTPTRCAKPRPSSRKALWTLLTSTWVAPCMNCALRRRLRDDEKPGSLRSRFFARRSRARRFTASRSRWKMRAGWDSNSINAPDMARRAQDVGIAAVFAHGRTAKQAFTGRADWFGDSPRQRSCRDSRHRLRRCGKRRRRAANADETGCDGVMVGRAAQGNPFLCSPPSRSF